MRRARAGLSGCVSVGKGEAGGGKGMLVCDCELLHLKSMLFGPLGQPTTHASHARYRSAGGDVHDVNLDRLVFVYPWALGVLGSGGSRTEK